MVRVSLFSYAFGGHDLLDNYFNVEITKFLSPLYTHTYDNIISFTTVPLTLVSQMLLAVLLVTVEA